MRTLRWGWLLLSLVLPAASAHADDWQALKMPVLPDTALAAELRGKEVAGMLDASDAQHKGVAYEAVDFDVVKTGRYRVLLAATGFRSRLALEDGKGKEWRVKGKATGGAWRLAIQRVDAW